MCVSATASDTGGHGGLRGAGDNVAEVGGVAGDQCELHLCDAGRRGRGDRRARDQGEAFVRLV